MTSVFEYDDDFRDYLQKIIQEKKLTYRALTEKSGLDHRLIYDVVNKTLHQGKQRHLTLSKAIKLSKALGHEKNETEYFTMLVFLTQSKDDDELDYYRSQLMRIKSELPNDIAPAILDKYDYYSTVRHSAVRSLIGLYPFKDDYHWLGEKLSPAISSEEARQSVHLLERLELIRKDKDGIYHLCDKNIWADISNKGKILFHRECSELVKKQIFYTFPNDCLVWNATLGMSRKTYEFVYSETRKLLDKTLKLVHNDNEADRVYLYQLIMVPLSKNEN